MTEEQLEKFLAEVVKRNQKWDEDFGGLVVSREAAFTELAYTDSGVGEDYVVKAFRMEWPDRNVDVDTEGGCDTCEWGRTVTITISGSPPWEPGL